MNKLELLDQGVTILESLGYQVRTGENRIGQFLVNDAIEPIDHVTGKLSTIFIQFYFADTDTTQVDYLNRLIEHYYSPYVSKNDYLSNQCNNLAEYKEYIKNQLMAQIKKKV